MGRTYANRRAIGCSSYCAEYRHARCGQMGCHCSCHEMSKPRLGLATTEQLLNEVAVRMEVTQNSVSGRQLASLCREGIAHLDASVLGYRTVDSH